MNLYAAIRDAEQTPAGFTQAYWTSGNFSPGDGTYDYSSAMVDAYVKKIPADALPIIDMEKVVLKAGLVPPGPEKDRLMLRVAKMIRYRLGKDRPFCFYGSAATIPVSLFGHVIEPTKANWLAMLDRMHQQQMLYRVCKTIEANLYISDAPGDPNRPAGGSVDRDISYFIQQARIIRAVNRDLPILVWVCGNSVVTGAKLPGETCAQIIAAGREWVDGVIVWGTSQGSDLMLAAAAN